MGATVRIVIALAFGLLAGAAIGQDVPLAVSTTAHVIGEVWLNLLRMTVAPLLFLLLATGAASAGKPARHGIAMVFGQS